ncbi:carboxymethylenebutenolidase [Aliidongia dinghuensis]|uniref:Carboxymethylenebutenolidase n=1 Tax=Aliidongia dinghuensis TaxID=1867774 RepID=A0A8J2YS27_9PROT|nr:dienelactone hydrolase family protein [Aliidongia dinghuensis]GGF07108.1 carboxymethylenebutenolidase [Aliidongia dinghuensis]
MRHVASDIAGLFPTMDLSRRGFVVTTLAAGFALTVQPVQASTITTDTEGLVAGEVQIPVADGTIPAYRAQPAKPGPHPVLLVVEEIFGVHEHIKDMCRRFAKQGYLAIAPELYSRLGDVVAMTDIKEVVATVNKAPDKTEMSDLDATVAWAGKNHGDTRRLGITGFCRGGRTVWMYAAHNHNLKAGVAWYGPLVGTPTDAMPTNPVDVAGEIKAPILGLYAGLDQGILKEHVETMRAKLLETGNTRSQIVVYPDAQHGFNADYRPSYNEADAKDGMSRCLAWLRANGVGQEEA